MDKIESMMTDAKFLTIPEFAAKLKVARNTVSRWVQAGKVKAIKKGPFPGKTSPILIPKSELERVLKLMDGEEQGNGHSKS